MLRLLVPILLLVACAPPPLAPPGPPSVIAQFGAPGRVTIVCGVVADRDDGAWLALDTDAELDGEVRGIRDLAIARVDAHGTVAWVRQIGATDVFTRGLTAQVSAAMLRRSRVIWLRMNSLKSSPSGLPSPCQRAMLTGS